MRTEHAQPQALALPVSSLNAQRNLPQNTQPLACPMAQPAPRTGWGGCEVVHALPIPCMCPPANAASSRLGVPGVPKWGVSCQLVASEWGKLPQHLGQPQCALTPKSPRLLPACPDLRSDHFVPFPGTKPQGQGLLWGSWFHHSP